MWLELTAQTLQRTTDITHITTVARRAAKNPGVEAAHQVLTAADDPADSTMASFRTAEIKNAAISLWQTSHPGTPGRTKLGQALARHHDFP